MKEIELKALCENFLFEGEFIVAAPYGDGHINDTYKVEYIDQDETVHYILQRVNRQVFRQIDDLMENIKNVTNYLLDMMDDEEILENYEVLRLIFTKEGESYYIDENGDAWRAYQFIENALGHTFAEDKEMLYHAAKAFARFSKMLREYPAHSLHETIPDFHHTKKRFEGFLMILEKDPYGRKVDCESEINFVLEREEMVSLIVNLLEKNELPLRVTHNDTKINNVLLDIFTGEGRCVIDLDTVMPGSVLYDFGDSIRSCASTAAEDEEDLSKVTFDRERFTAYAKGFLEVIGDELTSKETELLPMAGIMMTFECGMRFLTDHLNGDVYFKVHRPDHNLIRARNQFRLVREMEEQIEEIRNIISSYVHVS